MSYITLRPILLPDLCRGSFNIIIIIIIVIFFCTYRQKERKENINSDKNNLDCLDVVKVTIKGR